MDARTDRPQAEEAKELVRLCCTGRLYDIEKWIADGKALDVRVGKNKHAILFRVAVETGFPSLTELIAKHETNQASKSSTLEDAVCRTLRSATCISILPSGEDHDGHGLSRVNGSASCVWRHWLNSAIAIGNGGRARGSSVHRAPELCGELVIPKSIYASMFENLYSNCSFRPVKWDWGDRGFKC